MRCGFWFVAIMMLTLHDAMGAVPCPCTTGWVQKATHVALPCPGKPDGPRGVRGPIVLKFGGKVVARSDGPVGEITVCLGETNILVADDCTDFDVCAKPEPGASPCDWYDFQVSSAFNWTADPLIGRPSAVQTHPFPSHGQDFEINAQSLGAFTVTFTASEGPATNPDGSPTCRTDDGALSASVRVIVKEGCGTWCKEGEELRVLVEDTAFKRQSPPYRECPECVGPGGGTPCNQWQPMVFMPQGLPLAVSHYESSTYVHPGSECEFLTMECKTEGTPDPQTDLFFHHRLFARAGATQIGHCIFPKGCNAVYSKEVPARCGGKSRIAETMHLVQSPWPCPNGMYKFRVTRYRAYAGETAPPEEYSVYYGTSSVKCIKDPQNPGSCRYVKNEAFDVNIFARITNHITNSGEATAPCSPPTETAPS